MKVRFVEATNGFNWGKFMIGAFDDEWRKKSHVDEQPLLAGRGWTERHLLIVDLATGEGAIFLPGGSARADLNKHRVWVCPLFEPFLEWLYHYTKGFSLDRLPPTIHLPDAPSALTGFRRPGLDEVEEELGIEAIIALQAEVGIVEPREKAYDGWRKMTDFDRRMTLSTYNVVRRMRGGDR